jgi:PAS domain S-box-containing protein
LALERISLTRQILARDSEQYFRALVLNATDVILIVDPDDLRVRYASPSGSAMFGLRDVAGADLLSLVVPGSQQVAAGQIKAAPAGPAGGAGDWTMGRTDGTRVEVEAVCRDLRGEPSIAGVVVTLRDVTAQRRLQRQLTYQPTTTR